MASFACLLLVCSLIMVPVSVRAETVSMSAQFTVHAAIAPARSIIVNDDGKMTKIYSNTTQDVVPDVYVGDIDGKPLPLTPELQSQYATSIAAADTKIGLIAVKPIVSLIERPQPSEQLQKLFSGNTFASESNNSLSALSPLFLTKS